MTATDLVKQFVQNALNRAGLSHSTWHKDYSDHRLDAGDLKYGIDSFRQKDCAAEAAEEGIDGANWAGFEWFKRWEDDSLDRNCDHLTEAGRHFAIAYEHLRQYRTQRDAD